MSQAIITQERRQQILNTLYLRYPRPLGEGLLYSELQDRPDLDVNKIKLRQDLDYLAERHWIIVEMTDADLWMARINVAGIDRIEQSSEFNLALREQNRLLRLRVLTMLAINAGRPVAEALIPRMLASDRDLDLTAGAIHRALCYLTELKLARWLDRGLIKIMPDGTDYLAGQNDDLPGIARPAVF